MSAPFPPPPPPPGPPPLPPLNKNNTTISGNKDDSSLRPQSIKDYFVAKYDTEDAKFDPELGALHIAVGEVGQEDVNMMRIVHISDTHLAHSEYADAIPSGDVLVHSGDFTNHQSAIRAAKFHSLTPEQVLNREMAEMNKFFSSLPHKRKIFVAGNHETLISKFPKRTIQNLLTSATYLQDSSVIIEDVKFYGSPWTKCVGMGFPIGRTPPDDLWKKIPGDTDILVTHLPPEGIMDLAYSPSARVQNCQICGKNHTQRRHWGCKHLRHHIVNRIRPKAHLYGHVHDEHGVIIQDGVAFSNAAMDIDHTPIVIDLFYTPKQPIVADKAPPPRVDLGGKGGKKRCVIH